jgi:phosphate-selective porin O/P
MLIISGGNVMQNRSPVVFFLLSAVMVTLCCADPARAIPAFSRQHKSECSTCHTIYSELNEFGDAFLKNSYVWPGEKAAEKAAEAPGAERNIEGEGDPDTLKKLKTQALTLKGESAPEDGRKSGKNEGLWLAGVPEIIPISFTGSVTLAYNEHAANNNTWDLSTRSLRLQGGGAFREAAGFFTTFNLYSQGDQTRTGNTPANNTPDIDELFIVWRHAFDTPLNVKVGRFEPKLSLWKQSNKTVSVPNYAPHAYKVGSSQFSVDAPEDAVEINAVLGSRLFVAGGVVNRKGQDTKEGYGHISYKCGGTDFLGHEPLLDLDTESIWDYLTVTIGGYGYFGRNATLVNGVADKSNDFYRAGGDVDVLYKRLHLRAAGVAGRDRNPFFSSTPTELESHAFSAEGEYMFGSPVNLIALFRYEYQNDDIGTVRRYIPAVAYAPLQNTKLVAQFNYEDTPAGINRIGLATAAFSF